MHKNNEVTKPYIVAMQQNGELYNYSVSQMIPAL